MSTPRRATSLTLDSGLMAEAKAYKINISRAAESGIAAALREARTEAWKRENADGIAAWNRMIDESGVPLADLRKNF